MKDDAGNVLYVGKAKNLRSHRGHAARAMAEAIRRLG